jgi:hypothetical protein
VLGGSNILVIAANFLRKCVDRVELWYQYKSPDKVSMKVVLVIYYMLIFVSPESS